MSEHHPRAELQLDWDLEKLRSGGWPTGPDSYFIMSRLFSLPVEVTAEGGPGRVLEIAAAEAVHSCKLNLAGNDCFVVEPSTVMLERARERTRELGATLTLIRGVGETLPFAARTFDRVLLDSAIDHLADPEACVGEMARVLKPDGRLIVTFVNYGSLSTRISRALYEAARLAGRLSRERNLFWDSPIPVEHTFECTFPGLRRLCEPYLEPERAYGVSLGWMVPGWGALLSRLPVAQTQRILNGADRIARRHPDLADFVVSIWRPRLRPAPRRASPQARGGVALRVAADDVVYPSRARAEAAYWAKIDFGSGYFALLKSGDRRVNEAYTGDAERNWMQDLIARGPFRDAASLGCDEGGWERLWLEERGSARLDVYELSRGVIHKVRADLGPLRRRVRFIRADLNFASLPENAYDVIWSTGCLHHIVNLESLFAEVERALRPGGLFAFRDYVGEPRMQYGTERLRVINELMAEVPERFRRTDLVRAPRTQDLSPFCGIRSDEIVELAGRRFEWVHKGEAGALFPLNLGVDLGALEREMPELAERLTAADREAPRRHGFSPCAVYAVLRKR